MKLSEAIECIARRCGVKRGRVATIANRLQHAGMIAFTEAKKAPPALVPAEMAWLLLGALCERGIGNVAERARELSQLHESMAAVFAGAAQPGSVIVREGGAIATIGGVHVVYGQPAEDGFGRFLTTATFAAIVAEFNGATPFTAEAVRAITRISTNGGN